MKNKYLYRSKISEAKIRQIVRLFCIDLDALQISELTKLNRNTINRYMAVFRSRIADYCEAHNPLKTKDKYDNQPSVWIQSFNTKKTDSKNQYTVFGLHRYNDYIHTEIVPEPVRTSIQDYLKGCINIDCLIQSDGWRDYDSIIDFNHQKLFRIKHTNIILSDQPSHINNLESFWAFTKYRLSRFRGIHQHKLYFHLKECEFRFNYENKNIYKMILKILRENPIV